VLATIEDVGNAFGYFGHQNPLSLKISVGHQLPKDVTKILIMSPIMKLSRTSSQQHHNVTNMTVANFLSFYAILMQFVTNRMQLPV